MEQLLKNENELDADVNKKFEKFSYYICCFFVCSVVGWLYEVAFEFSRGSGFVNRGFLYGCYVPIYGFGTLLIYLTLNKLKENKVKIGKISVTPLVIFILAILITTTLEYVISWEMEMLFNQRWWDYSLEKYNLHGRVFLKNSILFGVMSTAYLYWIEPFFSKTIGKVKKNILNYTAMAIVSVMIIDFVFVLSKLL
jgi:uncharacterized membrane protein